MFMLLFILVALMLLVYIKPSFYIPPEKVIIVSPAGRRKTLALLIPQILELRSFVEEYRLWVNTYVKEDVDYMIEISNKYPDFIKLEYLPPGVNVEGQYSLHHFFKNCIDPNTVYVRIDDDVVLLDTLDSFKNFVEFRKNNPQYFLVFANILNNCITTNLTQTAGRIPKINNQIAEYNAFGGNCWNDANFAESLHRHILDNLPVSNFRTGANTEVVNYERVSINCISWLGEEFAKFNGIVGREEEQWLSSDKPKEISMPCCIYGDFVCVHYSFYTQKQHLDSTNILESYYKIKNIPFN